MNLEHYLARCEQRRREPYGTWAQRWVPTICQHPDVRCTHGDEIIERSWRRRVCRVCGRALRGELPIRCWYTGTPHQSRVQSSGSSEPVNERKTT